MSVTREIQADRLKKVAEELEKAAAHAKIASKHFIEQEVPRGCAHAVATEGHILAAREILDQVVKDHAIKARLDE